MAWTPEAVEAQTGKWSVDDLREGDLVFGQKASGALVTLCQLADEPWLHVGSVVDDNGELRVVEIRGDRFLLSDLSFFFSPERYVRWGAVRLRVWPDCRRAANEWMLSHMRDNGVRSPVFAWDDLVVAGLVSASQRGLLAKFPNEVRSAIAVAGAYCKQSMQHRGDTSLTCSSFIQLAYEAAGLALGNSTGGTGCTIEHHRWRSAPASWPERSPLIDEVFEMSEEELAGFDDVSVIDLYLNSVRLGRDTEMNRVRPGQVTEGLNVLLAAVAGFVVGDDPPPGLGVDSRWVTPGDLWRSPTVLERAYITPPDEWRRGVL